MGQVASITIPRRLWTGGQPGSDLLVLMHPAEGLWRTPSDQLTDQLILGLQRTVEYRLVMGDAVTQLSDRFKCVMDGLAMLCHGAARIEIREDAPQVRIP